ncbi:hypothetical protein TRFO_19073 [Tritrichomonas foetus]|uniref:Uncharacterized protein n=1 Tax=Tritrichomonas foetus TaxID=1144522 RepID=A0A1J4KK02_9EUKA|nr:hypothetical protein TRFO_19073 [Tritrichomonas foetus]|eukprot:OHT11442.1 hypothetical protein TRFO_19073 [Tritrichomonas foetus]
MIAPEYTIEDLEDTVVMTVTFAGRMASKCDLVVADLYAKFNLRPYFLMIDFPEKVSIKNVCASAKVNTLIIRVKKEVEQKWAPQPWKFEQDELKKRRDESFQRLVDAERARVEAERIAKEAAEKEAMQRAWDFEKQQREALKEAQELDKQYAQSNITGEDSAKELRSKPLYTPVEFAPSRGKISTQMMHTPTMKDQPARYTGPQRNFIVPKKGDASPLWMKQQGDAFYKNGDYRSAINAYTEAVDGSDRQFVAALSNRAAARLKLGQAKLALNDCDEGLALIADPIVSPEVGKMKCRLLSRKVQALFEEKRYVECFQACADILKYERGVPEVKEDLDLIIKLAGNKLKETKELQESLAKIEAMSKVKDDAPPEKK